MSTLVLLGMARAPGTRRACSPAGWTSGCRTPVPGRPITGGGLLRDHGLRPEIVHTSVLTRAIQTADLALRGEAGLLWIPVARSWRLNERHYGALQGKNKAQTREEFGEEQFMVWRRSYDIPPPPLPDDHPLSPAADPRYAHLPPELLPRTECLADVLHRLLPYWYDAIVPDLRGRPDGPGGCPRQLAARHGQASRRDRRRRDRRAEHPAPASRWSTIWTGASGRRCPAAGTRPRGGRQGRRGGAQPGAVPAAGPAKGGSAGLCPGKPRWPVSYWFIDTCGTSARVAPATRDAQRSAHTIET